MSDNTPIPPAGDGKSKTPIIQSPQTTIVKRPGEKKAGTPKPVVDKPKLGGGFMGAGPKPAEINLLDEEPEVKLAPAELKGPTATAAATPTATSTPSGLETFTTKAPNAPAGAQPTQEDKELDAKLAQWNTHARMLTELVRHQFPTPEKNAVAVIVAKKKTPAGDTYVYEFQLPTHMSEQDLVPRLKMSIKFIEGQHIKASEPREMWEAPAGTDLPDKLLSTTVTHRDGEIFISGIKTGKATPAHIFPAADARFVKVHHYRSIPISTEALDPAMPRFEAMLKEIKQHREPGVTRGVGEELSFEDLEKLATGEAFPPPASQVTDAQVTHGKNPGINKG